MKIELTKAQAKHLKWVLSKEAEELAECLCDSSLLMIKDIVEMPITILTIF